MMWKEEEEEEEDNNNNSKGHYFYKEEESTSLVCDYCTESGSGYLSLTFATLPSASHHSICQAKSAQTQRS